MFINDDIEVCFDTSIAIAFHSTQLPFFCENVGFHRTMSLFLLLHFAIQSHLTEYDYTPGSMSECQREKQG